MARRDGGWEGACACPVGEDFVFERGGCVGPEGPSTVCADTGGTWIDEGARRHCLCPDGRLLPRVNSG